MPCVIDWIESTILLQIVQVMMPAGLKFNANVVLYAVEMTMYHAMTQNGLGTMSRSGKAVILGGSGSLNQAP